MDKLAYSVNEVSRISSLSPQKVRRMIVAGELGHVRAGKRILVPAQVLEEFFTKGLEQKCAQR